MVLKTTEYVGKMMRRWDLKLCAHFFMVEIYIPHLSDFDLKVVKIKNIKPRYVLS